MNKDDVYNFILELIKEKLVLFNIGFDEVNNDFDLVKSGLVDSMSFIDLVAELEARYSLEIDFEQAAERDDFTRLGGLVKLITDAANA